MWSDSEPYKVHQYIDTLLAGYIWILNEITGIFCIATNKDVVTSDIITDLHASGG